MMELALNLAKKHYGLTGSNPSVGCVIARENKVVSIGVTEFGGNPHAEVMALSTGENFENCKMFVTLEPCNHHGKTPPCVEKIIASKISEVYIGMKDPDSRVNHAGIDALKAAGIRVEIGILEDKVKEFYKDYIKARTQEIPFVTAKIVCSLDGKIATFTGNSKWINSEKARLYTNFMRSKYGGILVGTQTFLKDSPALTCRIAGLEHFSPKKILYSNSIKQADGFEIVTGNEIKALKKLYKMGVNHLLIEGGASVISSFMKQDLIDEIIFLQSPIFIGITGKSAISFEGESLIKDAKKYTLKSNFLIGETIFTILQK